MANMRCTVKFLLDEVTCPGTLHLPDRNPVYITIFLFGRFQRSSNVYPSFPMGFSSKVKFQRLFTNAKTPEHVLEILEDETVLIELRQHTPGLRGGRVLAAYEESARIFLFPSRSYIPRKNHLKREVLLTRSDNFPIGKGLDPQLTFQTKTYIEEGPFISDIEDVPVNRQLPASISPTAKSNNSKTSGKKKKKKKKSISKLNESIVVTDSNENAKETADFELRKHCICDCPALEEEPAALDHWLESADKVQGKNSKVKPFRTGRAPKQLLSRRQFSDSFKRGKTYPKKGLCKYCLIPLPTCVLCNAYKTVYGPASFLGHRFKRENRKKQKKSNRISDSSQVYDSSKYASPPKANPQSVGKNNLETMGNLRPNKFNKSYSVTDYLDDEDLDGDYPPRASARVSIGDPLLLEERYTKSAPPKSKPKLFRNSLQSSTREEDQLEAKQIHEHIKNLMKANNSALQYDLSSSGSITDDDLDVDIDECHSSGLESDDVAPSTTDLWLKRLKENRINHRDRLDNRLKEIYADLYQKTLKNE